MEEIDGVVKLAELPNNVPPVAAEYQRVVLQPEAERLTVPVPHLEPAVVVGAEGRVRKEI